MSMSLLLIKRYGVLKRALCKDVGQQNVIGRLPMTPTFTCYSESESNDVLSTATAMKKIDFVDLH